mmetsp:Transcript_42565/g.129153  ORF Transcript_42565/g.129153 Transcript_42565/m.129153 type:complete len:321 (+) Transcript_42565:248-1210(+)
MNPDTEVGETPLLGQLGNRLPMAHDAASLPSSPLSPRGLSFCVAFRLPLLSSCSRRDNRRGGGVSFGVVRVALSERRRLRCFSSSSFAVSVVHQASSPPCSGPLSPWRSSSAGHPSTLATALARKPSSVTSRNSSVSCSRSEAAASVASALLLHLARGKGRVGLSFFTTVALGFSSARGAVAHPSSLPEAMISPKRVLFSPSPMSLSSSAKASQTRTPPPLAFFSSLLASPTRGRGRREARLPPSPFSASEALGILSHRRASCRCPCSSLVDQVEEMSSPDHGSDVSSSPITVSPPFRFSSEAACSMSLETSGSTEEGKP